VSYGYVPTGWTRTRLGAVLPMKYGSGLPGAKRAEGSVPVFGSNGIAGYHSTALTDGPTLIVGRKGSAGVVQLSPEPCWPIDTTYYTEGSEAIDLKFAFYLLRHCRLGALDRSTAVPSLSRDDYNAVKVAVAPRPEQHRIVAKIEELFSDLDAGVAALMRVRAKAKRYRASVLKAAVEGRLTAAWRAVHPDVEPAEKLLERILAERRAKWEAEQLRKYAEKGKALPKGWRGKYSNPPAPKPTKADATPGPWQPVTVDQLTAGDRPSAYGVLQPGADIATGVSIVRVCDVADGVVSVGQLKRIDPTISAKFPRTVLRGGEVLMTIVGTIGRTAIAPDGLAGANTARAVAVVPVTPLVNNRFVEIALRNPAMRSRLTQASHEVARKTLNLEDLRVATITLPPLGEQAEIVAEVDRRLSVVDAVEAEVEHALQRAGRLRQSILKRAFEGGLLGRT
jgi:type I restriction enzyme S subunit